MKTSGLKLHRYCLLLGCVVYFNVACTAQTTAEQKRLEQLPQKFTQLVETGVMPGAITTVIENGKIIHHSIVGYQDIQSKTPMAEDTIFRWYSMSKPITSVAIMMLVESGKMQLSDPIERFIPEFKNAQVYVSGDLDNMVTEPAKRSITIEDLLAHKSGITYHFTGTTPVHQYYRKYGVKRDTPVGALPTDGAPAKDLAQLVSRLASASLLYQPGEHFAYSYSTTVLGRIIEIVSQQPLDEFLQQKLFDPLQMKDAGFFVQGKKLDRFVTNYVLNDKGLQVIETKENTDYSSTARLLDGGGALAGTSDDYLKFVEMLTNGGQLNGVKIISEQSIKQLFTPRIKMEGLGLDYDMHFALGFAKGDEETEQHDFMPVGTFGWAGSGNTIFWINPTKKQAVLFMTQVITPPPYSEQVPFRKLLIDAVTDRTEH